MTAQSRLFYSGNKGISIPVWTVVSLNDASNL